MKTPEGFIKVEYEVAKVIFSRGGVVYGFDYPSVFTIKLLNESGEGRIVIYSHLSAISEYNDKDCLDFFTVNFVSEDDYYGYD